jgi:DNA polymerase elongation subunit (family B)
MNKNEKLELAKRWFDSIPKNVYNSYIDNDSLYIVIDEDDEYHIQVSYAEVSHRAEQFAEIINN